MKYIVPPKSLPLVFLFDFNLHCVHAEFEYFPVKRDDNFQGDRHV